MKIVFKFYDNYNRTLSLSGNHITKENWKDFVLNEIFGDNDVNALGIDERGWDNFESGNKRVGFRDDDFDWDYMGNYEGEGYLCFD